MPITPELGAVFRPEQTPKMWLVLYAHDRRFARHRCRVCNRIINAGERAWMARINNKGTKAIHAEPCATMKVGSGEYTGAELLGVQAVLFVNPKMPETQALAVTRAAITKHTGSTS